MSKITSLADLTQDPENRRKRTPRNLGMIVDSLHEVGAARSIVIDEDGVILAGNGVWEAAAEAGIERVRVVDADGEEVIAVRRSGLSPQQKRRLGIADNRAAELAEWDLTQIQADLDAGLDFEGLFHPQELDALLAGLTPESGLLDGVDPDAIPEQVETRAKAGDLWLCGEHRLLCGDCTKAEDVARLMGEAEPNLMVTDPPYGVDYDPKRRGVVGRGKQSDKGLVSNDDRGDWAEAYVLFPGAVAYVWHADKFTATVAAGLLEIGFMLRSQVVWSKPNLVPVPYGINREQVEDLGLYHFQHEPCWYAVRDGQSARWVGGRDQTTVWNIASTIEDRSTRHGTQKPVECMLRPLRNHEGDVYDPFLGSGTTLIAAEQLGRTCYGMEITPAYVDIALARWEAATGKTATLAY